MAASTIGQLLLQSLLLISLHRQAVTDNVIATEVNPTGFVPEDKPEDNKFTDFAELKKILLNLSTARQKVPPVTSLASGLQQVQVNLTAVLCSVLGIDDTRQILTSVIYLNALWMDPSLAWDPSNFSGVNEIELSADSIWIPSVFILNSATDFGSLFIRSHQLIVKSSGLVQAAVLTVSETMCNLEHGQFPFDTQVCFIHLFSFSSFVFLNIEAYKLEMDGTNTFIQESNWDLLNMYGGRVGYEIGVFVPSVRMELRRRHTFYVVCLLVPMVLTSYMNTLAFLVPLSCGEKVSYLVTIFVSTSVYTSFFTEVMPRSLDIVPSLMKLLLFVIAQSLLILLATVLVMHKLDQERSRGSPSCISSPSAVDRTHKAAKDVNNQDIACHKGEGLSRGVKVSPAMVNEDELSRASNAARKRPCFQITAKLLDRIFFVLAFSGNTAFMLLLLFEGRTQL